jgi:hypothetical protein
MMSQNDEAKLEAAVQRTMFALERYKPELMDRPKIHRLVHIVESLRRNGNCNETNGAVSHAALSLLFRCLRTSRRKLVMMRRATGTILPMTCYGVQSQGTCCDV